MLDRFGGVVHAPKPDAGKPDGARAEADGKPIAAHAAEPQDGQGEECRDESTLCDARDAFQSLVQTIWRLRQPDGCPWDRKQTHESIAKNMVEEAYEAVDCIEDGDVEHLREELGDVLMQVVLHAQIAADAGEFTMEDVARDIDEKLIRRHPHIFGDHAKAQSADEVLDIWDQVKLAEKSKRDADAEAANERPAGLLDGVPRSLPALMQAQKVSRKAAAVGFEWETVDDVWSQAESERKEFEREQPGTDARAVEFGDLLFSLVNVARKEGIDAESALRASTLKFRRRWEAIEEAAFEAGTSVEQLSTEQLNVMWDAVKRTECELESSQE